MATFSRVQAIPLNSKDILLSWVFSPVPTGEVVVTVYRSTIQEFDGEEEVIAPSIPDTAAPEWVDSGANHQNFFRLFFYRLKAVETPVTGPDVITYSAVFSWHEIEDPTNPSEKPFPYTGRLDPISLTIKDEIYRLMRNSAGTKGWLLSERTISQPCVHCVDPVTKRSTLSNCLVCAGTGKRYPYFDPVAIYLLFNPPTKELQLMDWELHSEFIPVMSGGYPLVKPRDLVLTTMDMRTYEIGKNIIVNGRWQDPTHHIFTLRALDAEDIRNHYTTQLGNSLVTTDRAEFRNRKLEREF